MSADEFKLGIKLICRSYENLIKNRDREKEEFTQQMAENEELIKKLYDKIHRLETENLTLSNQTNRDRRIITELEIQVKELKELKKTVLYNLNRDLSFLSFNSDLSSECVPEVKEKKEKSTRAESELAMDSTDQDTNLLKDAIEGKENEKCQFEDIDGFLMSLKEEIGTERFEVISKIVRQIRTGRKTFADGNEEIMDILKDFKQIVEKYADIVDKHECIK